jgi:hypothetical protein
MEKLEDIGKNTLTGRTLTEFQRRSEGKRTFERHLK